MKRVVSAWLPDWPVTVWTRPQPDGTGASHPRPPEGAPFALVEKGVHGLILLALNEPARALGLMRGQAHADACAMVPQLISVPAEPERDRDALRRLALWAERFSPSVAIDELAPGFEGLFLDMTGGRAPVRRRAGAARRPARSAGARRASPPPGHRRHPRRRLGAGAVLRPGGSDRPRRAHARGDRRPAGRGLTARGQGAFAAAGASA